MGGGHSATVVTDALAAVPSDPQSEVMNHRLAPFVSGLSVLAFMAWLFVTSGHERPDRSALPTVERQPRSALPEPCARPLAWHVADVDPRFGVDREDVNAAAREAATLWTRAAGKEVFRFGPASGIPIRLIYDARQARTEARVSREDRIRLEDSVLADAAADLTRAWEDHHETQARPRAARLVPDSVARELEADRVGLRARERALSDRMAARDEDVERLREAFPPLPMEAGTYTGSRGRDVGTDPHGYGEIRIFRFEDVDELVHVLAHELGHALGLGHVEEAGAVMSPSQRRERGVPGLHEADREALRAHCPSWVAPERDGRMGGPAPPR